MAKSTHSPEMPADWVCRRTSNGRELLRVHNPAQASLSPDGRIAVTLNSGNMTIWNVAVAKPLFDHLIGGDAVGPPMISPDSRHVAIGSKTYPRDVIGDWLRRIGLSSPFPREAGYRSVSIFDGLTGRPRGLVRGDFKSAVWSADSSQLAVTDQDGSTVRVWTVQPRKSLAWFAVGAALLALPIAFTAWRRGRKLIA
jgi:hypothetical protein